MRTNVAGRSLPLVVALAVLAVLVPFTQRAEANHGARYLNVTPDSDTFQNPEFEPDRNVTLTATLTENATSGTGAINIDFEAESGPNDPDGANDPASPDRTCTIFPGESSCTVSYFVNEPGDDQWRLWIDHDGLNESQGGETEADLFEGADEQTEPGVNPPDDAEIDSCVDNPESPNEPDCTDVVIIDVTGLTQAGSIDCDDPRGDDTERETRPTGGGNESNVTYNCKVFDENGNPMEDRDPDTGAFEGISMFGEVLGGANDPDNGTSYDEPDETCSTEDGSDEDNDCSITVAQQAPGDGSAVVCFWTTGQGEGTADAGLEHCETEGETVGENQRSTGADPENDLGDKTEITWEERHQAGLDVETEGAEVTVGGDRTLTATLYDQFGAPFQPPEGSVDVKFEIFSGSPADTAVGNTPETPDQTCAVSGSTSCSVTYSSDAAGLDLICAWINNTLPALRGNAHDASGTCGREARSDSDDEGGVADAPQPNDDRLDVVETTWLNDPPATVLECTPEQKSRLVRNRHTIKCTATTGEPDARVPNTEIDVEATGANDPDRGDSKTSADFWCKTNNNGVCTINHGGGRRTRNAGLTTYTAWIDANYHDSESEADASEGRNEGAAAGGTAEPDATDVVQNRWRSGDRNISLGAQNNANRGERVEFRGRINADAGKVCEADQVVKLQRKDPGDRRFQSTGEQKRTSDRGRFKIVDRVFADSIYRVVAPRNGGCGYAKSTGERVNT